MATAAVGAPDRAPACADGRQVGAPTPPAVRLYVGGDATWCGRERVLLEGDRCFTAAHRPRTIVADARRVDALLDSGAFSDPPPARLTPAGALARQLDWERRAGRLWGRPWTARALVSYDRLIDETWTAGVRHKRRWTVAAAERAVAETVDAAAYLAERRAELAPRSLVLSCQGVDPPQYAACAAAVLVHATVEDWIGLGGWCILGRWTSLLPAFWATLHAVLPLVAERGVRRVHLFGVLYRPALGGLLWLADRHGLEVSTDSSAPLLSARYLTAAARKKAGVRAIGWEANVGWWVRTLADLRATPYYRRPPYLPPLRQAGLWE